MDPSTSTKLPFAIPSCIKPEHRKFLPMYAAGGPSTSSEKPKTESMEVIKLPEEQNIVYIPKKVQNKQALVLVPPTQKRVLMKRLNPGAPVAEDNRDPDRHYCENCACNYKEKSDLRKHEHFMCMSSILFVTSARWYSTLITA